MATMDAYQARPRIPAPASSRAEAAFAELEASVGLALETYANVHRGSGYNSTATTHLYERARNTVLDACGLDRRRTTVVFCTPARAAALEAAVAPGCSTVLSSRDLGLPLGLRAVIVRRGALPKGQPLQTGGGTVKLVSRRSVVWEDAPDRFEAGTPPVINAIAFARALQLARRFGIGSFGEHLKEAASPSQVLYSDDLGGLSGRELLRRLRQTTIGRRHPAPTDGGFSPYIHLDNAASTPTFEAVWSAARRAWRLPVDRGAELAAEVRALCGGFFGAPADRYEVIFTSNATEAINIAAAALAGKPALGRVSEGDTVVLNTSAEHNSNELPWRFAKCGTLVRTPVDNEGFPDLTEMERLLKEYNEDRVHGPKRIRVVAVTGASNVLGTCPDLAEIARIAHRHGALVFVDAAQLAAHRAIRMAADGLDGLAFSGHKMYAPFGSGGLILRKELWPAGETEFESARKSGEENVAGVAALGKAIDLLERVGMDVIEEEESRLTRTALRDLAAVPGVRLFGVADPDSPRLARRLGVISFGLKNVPHNLAAQELAETAGIGVRTGCFCAHLLVQQLLRISPARQAAANLGLMVAPRLTQSLLPGLVRISLGLENDDADIRRLAQALRKIGGRRPSLLHRLLAKSHYAAPALPDTETRRLVQDAIEKEAGAVLGPTPAGLSEKRLEPQELAGRLASKVLPCCRQF